MFSTAELAIPSDMVVLKNFSLSYLLLDGYVEGSRRETKEINGFKLVTQYYQKEHSREYTIAEYRNGKQDGNVTLYDREAVKLKWCMKDGKRVGRFTEYKYGLVKRSGDWKYILHSNGDVPFIENRRYGKELVIYDHVTGNVIYRGDYLPDYETRNGYGTEYDRDTGKPMYYGLFQNGDLVSTLQDFQDNKIMYEYENDELVYIGEYCFSDDRGLFVRHGRGSLIDKTGIATWTGSWKDGAKLDGFQLTEDGWYVQEDEPAKVGEKAEEKVFVTVTSNTVLHKIPENVTDIVYDKSFNTSGNSRKIHFSKFPELETLSISSMCFVNCNTTEIINLRYLQHIVLGNDVGRGTFYNATINIIAGISI